MRRIYEGKIYIFKKNLKNDLQYYHPPPPPFSLPCSLRIYSLIFRNKIFIQLFTFHFMYSRYIYLLLLDIFRLAKLKSCITNCFTFRNYLMLLFWVYFQQNKNRDKKKTKYREFTNLLTNFTIKRYARLLFVIKRVVRMKRYAQIIYGLHF